MSQSNLNTLLKEIRKCQECANFLPHIPHPVLAISTKSQILIIGQAPGQKVHKRGVPWQDKSGDVLREWLGVSDEQFYNPDLFGILPMGFCFPGHNKKGSGDNPPRPECAPLWHDRVLHELTELKLTLLIGQYATTAYLGESKKRNLTETVRHFDDYLPKYFPLVHPSPLNFRWQAKNKWFISDVLPILKQKIHSII